MKSITKVGVITMHRVINYGSFLQTYATQRIIENLGYECEIIDYKFPNEWHFSNGLVDKRNIRTKITNLIYGLGLTKWHRKIKNVNLAIDKYLKLSQSYDSPEKIKYSPPEYDVYITGSDQTWNPKHTMADKTFLLDFAPKNRKRISFSASLAGKSIGNNSHETFKELLPLYDSISIRDANGNKIVKEIIGSEATVTLDPTLMLNRNEWAEFSKNNTSKFSKEKYIVFYLITHSFDTRPYIYELLKKLQEETGYKVYSFTKIPAEHRINYDLCSDLEMENFVELYQNSKYVVTSSFHGTAFAVNFGIPLYSVVNDVEAGDDRQSSLLNKLGIKNCLVKKGTLFESINPEYDIIEQQNRLEALRKESFKYLTKAL